MTVLPHAFAPPCFEVSPTAAIVPFPCEGVNSQTNLYPLSRAFDSVRFMLPRAVFAVEFTLLLAYATGRLSDDG